MTKTKAERITAVEEALSNQQLEGLKPSKFGRHLLQSYIKGDITSSGVIKELDKHYKGSPHVKVA